MKIIFVAITAIATICGIQFKNILPFQMLGCVTCAYLTWWNPTLFMRSERERKQPPKPKSLQQQQNQFSYSDKADRFTASDNVIRIDRHLILISTGEEWNDEGIKTSCACFWLLFACLLSTTSTTTTQTELTLPLWYGNELQYLYYKSIPSTADDFLGSVHVSSVYQLINMITCRVPSAFITSTQILLDRFVCLFVRCFVDKICV